MKIIFKPKFAPRGVFAPTFAPRMKLSPGKNLVHAPLPPERGGAPRKESMGLLAPIKHQASQGMHMLGGIGLGAGLMYVLDPDRGRRRRALARDQMARILHETGDALDKGLRDLSNRVSGGVIDLLSRFVPGTASDAILTERVRAALGRCAAYPQAIAVTVAGGHVTLTGHVLRRDVSRLMATVRWMKGVKGVADQLTIHEKPGEVPDMQGKPHYVRGRMRLGPKWTPAIRLGAAAAGGLLAFHGLTRRGLTGLGFGMVGLGMVGRALKKPAAHSFAAGDEFERGVDLQKTINVDAPLDRVFKMLANPENFPLFMSHVQHVKKLEDGAYRWTVTGPGGTMSHWDAEITKYVDYELLEWKTRPGAMVDHAGIVRLDPTPYGGTRIHIRVSYRPPLGPLGIPLAELFNLYPKHMLDEDLARFKSLLEQGKTTAHHHRVRLDDVVGR